MSYILPSVKMSVFHLYDFDSTITGGGQVVDFDASKTQVGSPESTYTASTGRTVLPDKLCILQGSVSYLKSAGPNTNIYIDTQWYDVTNSQYIGSKARVWGYRPDLYYGSYSLTCDEESVAIAQNITVELRIITMQVSGQTLVGDNSASYSADSRAIIMEFN